MNLSDLPQGIGDPPRPKSCRDCAYWQIDPYFPEGLSIWIGNGYPTESSEGKIVVGRRCHRFPEGTTTREDYWCGEYTPRA